MHQIWPILAILPNVQAKMGKCGFYLRAATIAKGLLKGAATIQR